VGQRSVEEDPQTHKSSRFPAAEVPPTPDWWMKLAAAAR